MATITTSTNAGPFLNGPAPTFLDRSVSSGYLYCLVKNSTANQLEVFVSTNNGTSWATTGLTLTRTGIQEWSGIWIDNNGYLHLAYRVFESGKDRICYRRAFNDNGTFTFDPEVIVAEATAASSGDIYSGVALAVVKISDNQFYAHLAVGTTSGSTHGVTMFTVQIVYQSQWPYWWLYAWVYTVNNSIIAGTRQWFVTGSGRIAPSIDIRHTGDGKTSSTHDVWVAWGRASIYLTKIAYGSGSWTGGAAVPVATPTAVQNGSVSGRYDSARFMVPVPNGSNVEVHERDASNTSTQVRTTGSSHPQGAIRNCTISYAPQTGDFRLYAVGTSNSVLYYIDYVRATGTWGAWTQVIATAIMGTNADNYGVRRSAYGNGRFDVYTAHSGSPNTLTHTSQVIVFPPDTPTITTPATGDAKDVGQALPFTWTFTDADPTDVQSGYALSRQIGAGALAYWRASDSTWQVAEVKNVTGTTGVTLPSGWGADADATHTYRVKVWDNSNTASSYSTPVAVVPSSPVDPTITNPTAGGTNIFSYVNVTWTVAQQTAYHVSLYLTTGMVAVHDSGWLSGAISNYQPPVTLSNNTDYTVVLTTKNTEGLESSEVSVDFEVVFVEPPLPTAVVSVHNDLGVLRITITNPTPVGSEPDLSNQDVYRRVVGSADDGVRVAKSLSSGATFDDFKASSGVDYEYRVLAFGVNGTSRYSAWVD